MLAVRPRIAYALAKTLTAFALITISSNGGASFESICFTLAPCRAAEQISVQSLKIGGIYYFAYEGISLKKIKQLMSVKEGEVVHFAPAEMRKLKERLLDAVHQATDDEPSDIAIIASDSTCYCYVGLRGKNLDNSTISIGSVGARSPLKVPEKLQAQYLEVVQADYRSSNIRSGTEKLKANLLREDLIKESLKDADELLQVSRSSSDALHRRIANYCLALIANNADQLDALARATHDSDANVRNDAIKFMATIAQKEALQALVPAIQLIPLLNSPTWSERNKGVDLVLQYTKSRPAEFLEELRKQALPSLKEIAAWDPDHARAALFILGRIGSIPEDKLAELINKDDRAAVLASLGQNTATQQLAKQQAQQKKAAQSAQKFVSKLNLDTKGGSSTPAEMKNTDSFGKASGKTGDTLPNGFYLVLRESPDNRHVHASGKNEAVLVNDYKFLAPEERDTAEYLVIDRTQYVPFDLKMDPNKQTDERGRPKLLVTLKDSQIKPLHDFTQKSVGKHVVIVVGGEVVTKHKIREPINGGLIQITRCTDNGCEAIYSELTRTKNP